MKEYRIVQTGRMRTGSTLLVNILYGLFESEDSVAIFDDNPNNKLFENNFIVKTHNCEFDDMDKLCDKYNVLYVVSERDDIDGTPINGSRANVCVIKYENILETECNTVDNIVNHVANTLTEILPKSLVNRMDRNKCINRINQMNSFYENTWKNKTFDEYNNIYLIHGKHRGRT